MAKLTPKEIGKRIRAARLARKLSQAELGRECEVSQATIQKIETGKHSNRGGSRFLIRIWLHLDLPPHEIDPVFADPAHRSAMMPSLEMQPNKTGGVSVVSIHWDALVTELFKTMRLLAPEQRTLFTASNARLGLSGMNEHGISVEIQLPDQSYIAIDFTFEVIANLFAQYQALQEGLARGLASSQKHPPAGGHSRHPLSLVAKETS